MISELEEVIVKEHLNWQKYGSERYIDRHLQDVILFLNSLGGFRPGGELNSWK